MRARWLQCHHGKTRSPRPPANCADKTRESLGGEDYRPALQVEREIYIILRLRQGYQLGTRIRKSRSASPGFLLDGAASNVGEHGLISFGEKFLDRSEQGLRSIN